MTGLRVLLAEDNALLRQGLARLLDDHEAIATVIECADLGELLDAVEHHAVDVVLSDIRMPPTHTSEGVEAANHLRSTHPELAVVLLSQYIDAEHALALVEQGSARRGYLLKERVSDVDQVVAALATVAAGGSVIDSEVVDTLMSARLRSVDSPVSRLTAREREVLGHIAAGASNPAIASALSVTSRAVEKHINSIFAKLDLTAADHTDRRVAAVLMFLADSGVRTMGAPQP